MTVIAIYHLSVKTISRNLGRSSVGAVAYRAGEKIINEYDGITHDYTQKTGIVHSEIILPENAPQEYKNRSVLWNAVEQSEKRKDARTAREIEIALPNELNLQEQITLVRGYVKENFVDEGMCADISFHAGHKHKRSGEEGSEHDKDIKASNPHVHIMLTTRPITERGFSEKKNRRWDKRENVLQWRENWAKACNKEFEKKGLNVRIDQRSLKDQGKTQRPTIHLGAAAHAMEQRGIQTERGNFNREVAALNRDIDKLQSRLDEAQRQQTTEKNIYRQGGDDVEYTQEIREKNEELRKKIRHLKADIKDIDEYQKAIIENERKFEALVAELQRSEHIKEQSHIERKMFSVRYSKEQAEQSLMRKYGIAKDQIPAKQKELADEIKTATQKQENFAQLLRQIHEPRETDEKNTPDHTKERELQAQTRVR